MLLYDFDLIILGSSSTRRQKIFEDNLGLRPDVDFIVMKSDFPEDLDKSKYTPQEYCLETSYHKLLDLQEKAKEKMRGSGKRWLLVTCDSTYIHNGIVYEKPRDREEARHFIMDIFRNSTMQAYTGVGLVHGFDEQILGSLKRGFTTDLEMWDYPAEMVDAYLDKFLDKLLKVSGGIGQEGAFLIKAFHGDFFNAAGVPYQGIMEMLLEIH